MNRIFIALSIFSMALLVGAVEQTAIQSDSEAWNEGVGYYRAGDATNALRVLRPLMSTRSHGARAAEVVAKLEHERGDREEAARAAQIALQANPGDSRANRNFTRAVDGLDTFREQRHINEVLERSQGKDPGGMLLAATYDARSLMQGIVAQATNRPERAVRFADAAEKRAEAIADAWIPVRVAIMQAVTNEEQQATIVQQVENARAKSKTAAEGLGNLDESAYSAVAEVEQDLTRFLKMTVMPPAAIDEGEKAQSNAWMDVEVVNGRPWQQEALDYTRAFRAKFPAWARAYEQQAQADTNKPPFTAEAQNKISALATELEKLQLECVEKNLPPKQERALAVIREIKDLLPKDKKGGGQQQNQNQQQQQQNQQQNQEQQQQNQEQQQQNQDQQQGQDQQQDQNQENGEQNAEEKDSGEEESPEEKEIEAVLKKAQERSDEHEAEKKARMRKAPLPPNARDW